MATTNTLNTCTLRNYCYGVDIGSNKITISQNSVNSSNSLTKGYVSEILGDLMDIRKIPNMVSLPETNGSSRAFGNAVSSFKACNLSSLTDDVESLHPFKIHGEEYMLPLFYVRNMIMSNIRNIIKFRLNSNDCSPIKNIAFVPRFSHIDNPRLMMAEILGTKIALTTNIPIETPNDNDDTIDVTFADDDIKNVTLLPIHDVDALAFAYLNKCVINDDKYNKCDSLVILVDIGYSKSQVIKLHIRKNGDNSFIMDRLAYAAKDMGNKQIDEALTEYILQKINKTNPMFQFGKRSSLIEQIIKLKHQLSTNQKIVAWIQGIDNDVSIEITRDEFISVLESIKFKEHILEMLKIVDFTKTKTTPTTTSTTTTTTSAKPATATIFRFCIEIVGGGARIPYVSAAINEYIGDKCHIEKSFSLNPDETVAEGANIYACLFHNNNKLKLDYYKRITHNIYIEYSINDDNVPTAEKIFNTGDKIKFSNTSKEEAKKITIDAKLGYFKLHIGKYRENTILIKMLELPKEAEKVDVYATYTMVDTVDISIKYNDISVNYEIDAAYDMLNMSDKSMTNKMFDRYQTIERILLRKDNGVVLKHKLTNYLEDFYNRKDEIDYLIHKIQDVNNIPQESRINSVDDTNIANITSLRSPIKELYEFYHFCRGYMYDADTGENSILEKRKEHIDVILNNMYNVMKLTEATIILDGIKTKYNQ